MKLLTSIICVIAVCVAALVIFRKTQAVSADVISCAIDEGSARVAMRYRNRSAEPVTLSYDLIVVRDISARRAASGRSEPLKSRQITGVMLAAGESREEVISIAMPAEILVANALVESMSYCRQSSREN